jgi:hypothetical protein
VFLAILCVLIFLVALEVLQDPLDLDLTSLNKTEVKVSKF